MITKTKFFRYTKSIVFYFSGLIVIGSIYYLAHRYSFSMPLASQRMLLCPTTLNLIDCFHEPVQLTLYSRDSDKYHTTELLVEQYQHKNPLFQFSWKQDDYHFSEKHVGEALVVEHQNQKQFIDLSRSSISEAELSQLLFKFKRHANTWVVFLQGHGEPDLFGKENRDFSLWQIALKNQGLKIQPLTLSNTPFIANNTQLLVIASVQSELLEQEKNLILTYLDNGGDLLWLMDPQSKRLDFLEHYFGVAPLPGIIIDLHGQKLGTPHPAITLIEHYPSLPFSAPNLLSAYPWSSALNVYPSSWENQPLLLTSSETWTETNTLSGKIEFEPEKGEVAGPLLLGVSLTRPHPHLSAQQQRVAIIGNSRFISNGVIENYGNLGFGQNLISWLNHDDQLLALEQPVSSDSFAHIHLITAYIIQYGFSGLGFLALLAIAFYSFKRLHNSRKFSAFFLRE